MNRPSRLLSILGIGLVLSLSAGADADAARRGGSFGSRGMRTYNAPRPTQTAPGQTAPLQRSMTPRQQPGQQANRPAAAPFSPGAQAQRGGFLRRWAGPLLGGLALGGLVGMLMGHGMGAGMGGMISLLLQVALIGGLAMLVIGFLRRRQQGPAVAGAAPGGTVSQFGDYRDGRFEPARPGVMGMTGGMMGGMGLGSQPDPRAAPGREGDEIGLSDSDFDEFERLLNEVQTSFGRADWDGLRAVTTPEAMSYLSQDLAQNAAEGRRNSVTDVKLLQGDLSEAWREDDADYATVAMRFASIDVTYDASGAVVDGDPNRPTETTELWTFKKVRGPWGERWKLAAIQDT